MWVRKAKHSWSCCRPHPGKSTAAVHDERPVIFLMQAGTGGRDNPTYELLIGLSRFFGVSPAYFFDDAETERGTIPAEVALTLRDDAVRDIALRSAGLSERSLKIIADTVTSARAEERLGPGPAASPSQPRRSRRSRRRPQAGRAPGVR